MPAIFEDKTDIKLFILTLLSGLIDPLNDVTIHDIVCKDNKVNSFDFAECFEELIELGHVLCDDSMGEKLYAISDTGRQVAEELHDSIPESICHKSAVEAAKWLTLRRTGTKISCDIEELGPCRYMVKCQITDERGKMLDVSIRVSDRQTAQQIKEHMPSKPESTMRGLLSVLTGEIDYLLG